MQAKWLKGNDKKTVVQGHSSQVMDLILKHKNVQLMNFVVNTLKLFTLIK